MKKAVEMTDPPAARITDITSAESAKTALYGALQGLVAVLVTGPVTAKAELDAMYVAIDRAIEAAEAEVVQKWGHATGCRCHGSLTRSHYTQLYLDGGAAHLHPYRDPRCAPEVKP